MIRILVGWAKVVTTQGSQAEVKIGNVLIAMKFVIDAIFLYLPILKCPRFQSTVRLSSNRMSISTTQITTAWPQLNFPYSLNFHSHWLAASSMTTISS